MITTGAWRSWNRHSLRSSTFFQPRRAAFWLYLLLLVPFGVLEIMTLVWGGVIAGGIAGHPNNNLFTLMTRANPDMVQAWGAALAAPTTEEILKAQALAGLGFQFLENLLYLFQNGNPLDVGATLQSVLQIFVLRAVILGAFMHATWTALVGFGIGYYVVKRESPLSQHLLVLVGLFIAAWLFHFLHNGPAMNWPALTGVPQLGLLGLLTAIVPNELITPEEADALSSLRRRRRARSAARKAGGRDASKLVAELPHAQITYARAKDGSAPESPELDPPRQRIWEVRRSLSRSARPSVAGA